MAQIILPTLLILDWRLNENFMIKNPAILNVVGDKYIISYLS